MTESAGLLKFGLIIACMVAVAILYAAIASSQSVDDSPKAQLERIRDECNRTYGQGTQRSIDCFIQLGTQMATEQRRDELNRIYQRAK
ncbi:hypothetical protein AAFG07_20905 [Bradyrhizobium sp. B097]|uniref:hypothetical protein n=1 Tax=Bradyrhizobium sp. B097 TaxID=3140244 RepID=UPI003183E7F2